MKVLIIMGGWRQGATYNAVMRFIQSMELHGEVQSQMIWIKDLALKDCIGCHACIHKGETYCPEHEKIGQVIRMMEEADGVIIASPVYNDTVTALLKRYFDYSSFLWHRPRLHRQWFFGIASGGGMFKQIFKDMKKNVTAWGGTWVGGLGVPHYDSLTDRFREKCNANQLKQSKMLMKGVPLKTLTVGKLIWFKMWKMNSEVGRETMPCDYAFYKNKHYYQEIKIPVMLDMVSGVAIALMRKMMKSIYRGY